MRIEELTPLEERAYLTLVDTKKKIVLPEAEAIKAERIQSEAPVLAARQHIPIEQAVEVLTSRSTGNLLAHDVIRFQLLGDVAVSAVLENLEKYDNQPCADPLEPEEGTNRAKFYANTDTESGTPLIHSMLHGGASYYLTHTTDNSKYPGNAVPAGMTKKDVIHKLTDMTQNELSSGRWCEVLSAANISQTETDSVLDLLAATMQTKKNLLKKEYADHLYRAEATASFDQLKKTANGKVLIEYTEHNLNEATALAEQAIMEVPGEWPYFNYGNVLSYSTYDCLVNKTVGVDDEKPPEIPVIKAYTKDNLHLRIEQSAMHYKAKKGANGTETQTPIATPQAIVNKLFDHPAPLAPRVSGLVSHPVLALDGKVIDSEGIDAHTGLLLQFGGSFFKPLPSQISREDASKAADKIFRYMFADLCFKKSSVQEMLYETTALALLLTGVFRKVIDQAPGFLIVANVQGSGKTSLARMVHVILTGRDMPASSLGSSAEEMKKELLATFMQSPAMVCYDNVLDGSEINDPILAKAITSPEFKGRILGRTQEATVPTNTVIAITGNNVTLAVDLVRRFVTVSLTADTAQPERKTYQHPDIVQHCLNIRRGVIHDCLLITKAYIDAGCPIDVAEVGSSGFVQWDKMVRFPLLWATGIDVLHSMDENRNQSSEHLAMVKVLNNLYELFGAEPFTASKVMECVQEGQESPEKIVESLREGLVHMTSKALHSIKSLTWALKKLDGRIIDDKVIHKQQIRNRADEYMIRECKDKEIWRENGIRKQ